MAVACGPRGSASGLSAAKTATATSVNAAQRSWKRLSRLSRKSRRRSVLSGGNSHSDVCCMNEQSSGPCGTHGCGDERCREAKARHWLQPHRQQGRQAALSHVSRVDDRQVLRVNHQACARHAVAPGCGGAATLRVGQQRQRQVICAWLHKEGARVSAAVTTGADNFDAVPPKAPSRRTRAARRRACRADWAARHAQARGPVRAPPWRARAPARCGPAR